MNHENVIGLGLLGLLAVMLLMHLVAWLIDLKTLNKLVNMADPKKIEWVKAVYYTDRSQGYFTLKIGEKENMIEFSTSRCYEKAKAFLKEHSSVSERCLILGGA